MGNQVASVVMLPHLYTLLRQYQRLSYNPWTALAEFVDNSTESWFQNKHILKENGINGIRIDIDYDRILDRLTIRDSAYGMELEDFKRAVILGAKPTKKSRNEYGFGLKTAACWFGNKWEVHSTQLNSPNKYSVVIDIDEIERIKTNEIDITLEKAEESEHWTEIVIHDVSQRMKDPGVKNKISQNLAFKYRRDIKSGAIRIFYNGEPIEYKDPKILYFRDKEWMKNLNFSFSFNGKTYNVTGFVGIFAKGTRYSYQRAGFGLFMDDRTIIGGFGLNYKHKDIFTNDPKSQIAGKLFGEINLNDIPVNQAKDNFIWGDGLEQAFVNALKGNIKEYIDVARMGYKDMEAEERKRKLEEKETKDNDFHEESDSKKETGEKREVFSRKNGTDGFNNETNGTDGNDEEASEEKPILVTYSINGVEDEVIEVKLDNTLHVAYLLERNGEAISINYDHAQYKNSEDKELYIKQCISFALLEDSLKIVYGNTSLTLHMLRDDLVKRYFEIFNSIRGI